MFYIGILQPVIGNDKYIYYLQQQDDNNSSNKTVIAKNKNKTQCFKR